MMALLSELKILIHVGQHLNIVNLLGAVTKDIRYGTQRFWWIQAKSRYVENLENGNNVVLQS